MVIRGPPGYLFCARFLLYGQIGTIVSIQENPLPGPYIPTDPEREAILQVVRRNILFTFSGVSKQHSALSDSETLVTIRVRPFSANGSSEQAPIKQEDGPSLILYYIFDDWVSTYGLVSRREHKYAHQLDKLVGVSRSKIGVPTKLTEN
jgi:hypothetical protein